MTTFVFLHGAYGAADDFDEIRHAMLARVQASAGAETALPTLLALHLPGHGPVVADPSPAETTASTTTADKADDVDGLFEQAAFLLARSIGEIDDDVVVVGYSLGARLALAAILLHPELVKRVQRLVLISGTAGLNDEADKDRRRELDDMRAADFADNPAAFLADFWRLPLFADLAGHTGMTTLLLARQERAASQTALRARWMRGLSVARMPSLWPLLSSLPSSMSVDVIVGADDHDYIVAAHRINTAVPHAQLHFVAGVKHALPILAPQAIIDVLLTNGGNDDSDDSKRETA